MKTKCRLPKVRWVPCAVGGNSTGLRFPKLPHKDSRPRGRHPERSCRENSKRRAQRPDGLILPEQRPRKMRERAVKKKKSQMRSRPTTRSQLAVVASCCAAFGLLNLAGDLFRRRVYHAIDAQYTRQDPA